MRKAMILALLIPLTLVGCAAPINTRAADPTIAGRCKLLSYREDRGHVSWGLIPMIINQANADARRQDMYDACVAAGGSREAPPEMP